MKKAIKIIIWIVILLVIVGAIILYFPRIAGMVTRDISAVDDSAIRPSFEQISDAQNMYFDLEKIPKNTYVKTDATIINDILSGKNADKTLASKIIAKNSVALATFTKASTKTVYQNPSYTDLAQLSPDTVLPPLNEWRETSKISAVKSLSLSEQKKYAEAIEEALKSVKVGQVLSHSYVSTIEYLVGLAMKGIGLSTIEKILPASTLTKVEHKKYADELRGLRDTGEGLKRTFALEHYIRVRFVDLMATGNPETVEQLPNEVQAKLQKGNFYFRPNKMKQLSVDLVKVQVANVDVSCEGVSSSTLPIPALRAPKSSMALYFTENAVGKILTDVVGGTLNSIYLKRCEYNDQLDKVVKMLESK